MRFQAKQIVTAVSLALSSSALVTANMQVWAQTPTSTEAQKAVEETKKNEDAKAAEATKKTDAANVADKPNVSQAIDKITVTGIRASLEKSLDVKRDAGANVEVITAEDVGKMPDKNLADSLQRLAGVAVRTDYDEAEKVSIRGTNPDMNLILFNGHTVSGGDWYVADQGSSSRSTSLSLMPSSVLNQAQVYKTSQANLVDGGLAGTINVTTRKPLDATKGFSGVASVGGVYADLPNKTSANLNANLNWKNEANTLGFIGQVFSEKRYMRRDSVSRLAYGPSNGWGEINTATMLGITDASLAGTGLRAADLNGVRMPGSLSSEFVEGVRDRKGGMFAAQIKPMAGLDISVTGFYSEMGANNFGRLTSGAIYSMLLGYGGTTGQLTPTNSNGQRVYASIRNPVIINTTSNYGYPLRVLQSADIVFADGTTPQYVGNSEGFYRDGAKASSGFADVDLKYRFNDDFEIRSLFSTTRGVGTTQLDQGATFARFGTGISYRLNGLREAPDVRYIGAGPNEPVLRADGSGYQLVSFGASSVKTVDKESSFAFDTTYKQHWGALSSVEAGIRYADHNRDLTRTAPARRALALPAVPTTGYANFPSNFGEGLGGGNWDRTGFYLTSEALRNFIGTLFKPTSTEYERRVAGEIDMREQQSAVYLMQNLEGERWSGNIGLRLVRTQVNAEIVTPIRAGLCQRIEPGKPEVPCAAVPGAIVTAGDGSSFYDGTAWNPTSGTIYYKTPTERTFNDVLPSINLRYELQTDVIGRFGASKTIGRQNYNVLGSGFAIPTCNAQGCNVTGPNPNLKPLYSRNLDLSLAWYFARRSIASVNLFKSKIEGYVKTGANVQGETIDLVDPLDNVTKPFFINSSSQQRAEIQGYELQFERPIYGGFGVQVNYSRAKTKVDDGRPLVGASDKAANVGVYFENDTFSARLVYNYRGEYVAASTAPAPTANSQSTSTINGAVQPTALLWAAPVSTVAFSMNYDINQNFRVSLDATNLLNTIRAQYRYSEAEQQKLDVSGRQYYFTLRYKF
jgi:iron complex outermembrane recepter protein